jgi:hypothetical protein
MSDCADPEVARLIARALAEEVAGRIGASLDGATAALERARRVGSAADCAAALALAGVLHWRLGRFAEAAELARTALAQTVPETMTRASALVTLGMCASDTNDLAAGEAFLLEAAEICRRIGARRGLMVTLHNLACNVQLPRGKFALALAGAGAAAAGALPLALPDGRDGPRRLTPAAGVDGGLRAIRGGAGSGIGGRGRG